MTNTDELQIVIIGGSGHYKYALDGLTAIPGLSITGIAPGAPGENLDALRKSLAARGEKPAEYQDYRSMLDDQKPRYSVINTIFNVQAEVAAEVLKRDIHAFIEKPLATTIADLEALEEAYRQSSGSAIAMLGLRFTPHFFTAWKAVRDGAVGSVRLLNAQKSYKLGTRSDMYRTRKTFGGTIPWVGIHGIDLIQWFAGNPFINVFAKHSTRANRGHGDLETTGLCLFDLENEIIASLTIDYLRPENAPTHGDDRIRVVGSDGTIEVLHEKALLINRRTRGIEELPLEDPGNIFAAFVRGVDDESLLNAQESFEATRIALLARQSADEGKQIRCTDELDLSTIRRGE